MFCFVAVYLKYVEIYYVELVQDLLAGHVGFIQGWFQAIGFVIGSVQGLFKIYVSVAQSFFGLIQHVFRIGSWLVQMLFKVGSEFLDGQLGRVCGPL